MKIIVVEDKIVVLNNVKEINLFTDYTGSAKNPIRHCIRIDYFGNETAFMDFKRDNTKAKETFDEIARILSENA